MHQSLANMCLKVGNTGSVFGRIHDSILYSCHYTVKKCRKEIEKTREEVKNETAFFNNAPTADQQDSEENIDRGEQHRQSELLKSHLQEEINRLQIKRVSSSSKDPRLELPVD